MSHHKTRPVQHSDRVWVIARERGNRVRYQDRTTGRMTGWCASPAYLARQAETMRQAENMRRLPVVHTRSTLEAYTVANIRTAAENVFEVTFKSKMRKSEMIDAYLAMQAGRLA